MPPLLAALGLCYRSAEFVKFDEAPVLAMSDRPKDAKKNKDVDEGEENPTNIGPGITEAHEEA